VDQYSATLLKCLYFNAILKQKSRKVTEIFEFYALFNINNRLNVIILDKHVIISIKTHTKLIVVFEYDEINIRCNS